MFGHNQTQDQSAYNQTGAPADVDTTTHDPAGADPAVAPVSDPGQVAATMSNLELPGSSAFPGTINPPAPTTDNTGAPAPVVSAPAAPISAPVESPELLSIKQEALQHLAPLVDHLDQTPEERFRTTMMMIQATDDSSKIKAAYEAAQLITDEKVKAQALLDVVNEINYFAHKG